MPSREGVPVTVEEARKGNREAFDGLADRCRAPLEGHVRRRIGSYLRGRVECEDVVQETFARAWKSIAGFRGENERSLLAWLEGIAEHVILDFVSRHRRADVLYLRESDGPAPSQASPSRGLRREERFARLQKALDGLSPEYREVVALVRIEGLKIREAAERMQRTPNATMKLLTRALKKLKDSFGDTESLHLPPRRLDGGGGSPDGE